MERNPGIELSASDSKGLKLPVDYAVYNMTHVQIDILLYVQIDKWDRNS